MPLKTITERAEDLLIKKGGGGEETRTKFVLNWRHLQEMFGGTSTTNGGLCINTMNAIKLLYLHLYNTNSMMQIMKENQTS